MKNLQTHYFYSVLIIVSLLLVSCNKDDDSTNDSDTSVNIEVGRIAFDVSGFETAGMDGDVVYFLNNSYSLKYLTISNDAHIIHNDKIWNITIEQNSNDAIALPEPGEYPIVQGLSNTYDQTSFNATISMFTDMMTDTGTHFGGNNGAITGTLKIVSNTDNIIKGTFNFEAFTSDGEKITVTNGQFAAPKHTW